jgi:hypothetical protein
VGTRYVISAYLEYDPLAAERFSRNRPWGLGTEPSSVTAHGAPADASTQPQGSFGSRNDSARRLSKVATDEGLSTRGLVCHIFYMSRPRSSGDRAPVS